MVATDGALLRFVAILIGATSAVAGEKYNINDHALQIFKIVEETVHAINGIEITMEPSYFNYLVPFTMVVECSDGTMDVSDLEHIQPEDSYMEVINETHSYIQARFAITELSYKYDFCWLNFGLPVPIWLQGKVTNSQYFVSATLIYKPQCRVIIEKANLVSYGKLTVNLFQWMPGVIGDWLLNAITKNAQDRISVTVEKSIKRNAEALTGSYNPCIVFPSMGKMTPYEPNQGIEGSGSHDKIENDPSWIGHLLDVSETEPSGIGNVRKNLSHREDSNNQEEL